jgi:hypothetical protein
MSRVIVVPSGWGISTGLEKHGRAINDTVPNRIAIVSRDIFFMSLSFF